MFSSSTQECRAAAVEPTCECTGIVCLITGNEVNGAIHRPMSAFSLEAQAYQLAGFDATGWGQKHAAIRRYKKLWRAAAGRV